MLAGYNFFPKHSTYLNEFFEKSVHLKNGSSSSICLATLDFSTSENNRTNFQENRAQHLCISFYDHIRFPFLNREKTSHVPLFRNMETGLSHGTSSSVPIISNISNFSFSEIGRLQMSLKTRHLNVF